MILTDEERKRFIEYLEQDILSDQSLIRQMSDLPGMTMLAERYRRELHAATIVVNKLRTLESFTVKGKS